MFYNKDGVRTADGAVMFEVLDKKELWYIEQKDSEGEASLKAGAPYIFICKDRHYAHYVKHTRFIGRAAPLLSESMTKALIGIMKNGDLKVEIGGVTKTVSELKFEDIIKNLNGIFIHVDNSVFMSENKIRPEYIQRIQETFGYTTTGNKYDQYTAIPSNLQITNYVPTGIYDRWGRPIYNVNGFINWFVQVNPFIFWENLDHIANGNIMMYDVLNPGSSTSAVVQNIFYLYIQDIDRL